MSFFFTISGEKETDSREKSRISPNEPVRRDMLPIYLFLVVILLVIVMVSVCQSSRILVLSRELDALKDAFSGFSELHDATAARESEASVFP